jgi:hypothetical protein
METEPKSEYTLEEQGPFLRAYLKVFGRTPQEAIEMGRIVRAQLAVMLSKECTCYPPRYRGFDDAARRHHAVVVVALGGDRIEARKRLDQFVTHLSDR